MAISSSRPALALALSALICVVGIALEASGGRPPRGGFVAVVGVLGTLIAVELIAQSARLSRLESRSPGVGPDVPGG